jgi:hypothetical protein
LGAFLKFRKNSLPLTLAGAAIALAASSAFAKPLDRLITAPDIPPRNDCSMPALTQALLDHGDAESYFLAPGGSFEADGGWYLGGGARLTEAPDEHGHESGVLELPSDGQAVSPVICVTSRFPLARVFARSGRGGGDVDFGVSYYEHGRWSKYRQTGRISVKGEDWNLSDPLGLRPDRKKKGWQQVRLAFYGGGDHRLLQIDNLWIDPRASRKAK